MPSEAGGAIAENTEESAVAASEPAQEKARFSPPAANVSPRQLAAMGCKRALD
jgi:hypothetical protein